MLAIDVSDLPKRESMPPAFSALDQSLPSCNGTLSLHLCMISTPAFQAASPQSLLWAAQLSQPELACSRLALLGVGAISMPGLASKKLTGLRWKPTVSTGMTGQSSSRGTCVTPKLCHTTTSAFFTSRFCTQAHHIHFKRQWQGKAHPPRRAAMSMWPHCIPHSNTTSLPPHHDIKESTGSTSSTKCQEHAVYLIQQVLKLINNSYQQFSTLARSRASNMSGSFSAHILRDRA